MIFQATHHLVMEGKKTETRRLMKPWVAPSSPYRETGKGRRVRRAIPKTVEVDGQVYVAPPAVGKDLAVCPARGREQVGRVVVTDVRHELLGDITHHGAIAEGFRNTAAFKVTWVNLHDKAWTARHADDITEQDFLTRFDSTHADTMVWVIQFELVRDEHRFLALDSSRGYVTNPAQALPDEPEAVPGLFQQRLAATASKRDATIRQTRVSQGSTIVDLGLRLLDTGHATERRTARQVRRQISQLDGTTDRKWLTCPECDRPLSFTVHPDETWEACCPDHGTVLQENNKEADAA